MIKEYSDKFSGKDQVSGEYVASTNGRRAIEAEQSVLDKTNEIKKNISEIKEKISQQSSGYNTRDDEAGF